MTAAELFEQGQLQAAIDAQVGYVKNHPADRGGRFLLYQFLLFTGDMDRAEKHLNLLDSDEVGAAAAVRLYKAAGEAERARRRVLAGTERPQFLTDVPNHVELRLEALQQYAAGDRSAAHQLLDRANEESPDVNGTIDGQSVRGLRDADDLFGNVLEVFGSNGAYCWVPLEQVEGLTVTEPKTPKDMVFLATHLVMTNGDNGDVLLPGLYPDTPANAGPDDALRLGRAVDWVGAEGEPVRGVGGRLLAHSEGHVPLVNVREITISAG